MIGWPCLKFGAKHFLFSLSNVLISEGQWKKCSETSLVEVEPRVGISLDLITIAPCMGRVLFEQKRLR